MHDSSPTLNGAPHASAEERLRLFVENSPAAVAMLDRDMRYLLASHRWLEDYGLDSSIVGKSHYEIFPEIPEAWRQVHRRCLSGARERSEEDRFTRADGTVVWQRWEVIPWREPDGSIGGLLILAEDISERKHSQDKLEKSEDQFRQLADAMPQIVWTADERGVVNYLNRRWTEYTGLPADISNDGWSRILHPEDAPEARRRWKISLDTSEPFEFELRLKNASGGYAWHLMRTVPALSAEGQVVRWYGTATNIDQQKRAEETSRYLAEASAELATVVNHESTLQRVANLAVPYFADWSAADVVDGKTLRRLAVAHAEAEKLDLVRKIEADYPTDLERDSGAGHVLRTAESLLIGDITDEMLAQGARDERHLGMIRQLGLKSYMCVPLIIGGRVYGLLTFATAESGRHYGEAELRLAKDLAYRAAIAIQNTQLFQALKESDRRKDEFLATLAHELRNPLAPIRNGLQILELIDDKEPEAVATRAMMDRQLSHMVRLIDDLLDISRVTSNRLELRKERVELASVVRNAVDTSRLLIEESGHSLSVRLPATPIYLNADPVRLCQVISNLLNNSAKYTDAGGRIELSAAVQGLDVVVEVSDNGTGIAAADLPRVFEMFAQINPNMARSKSGLGIGLALVRRLVELHGGRIEATSEGQGLGCRFRVLLPIASSLGPTLGGYEANTTNSNQAPCRLLVVDDNQDAARSLSKMLELMGHTVCVEFDGESAIDAAEKHHPDIILLDIGLPRMNGYEACRRIRLEAWGRDIVLVALTGWGQEEDRRRSAEAGFDDHLVKPVSASDLRSLLAKPRSTRS